jgi:hypothetical protein
MYSAAMANNCGLNSWTCNSECIVATSKTIQGPYEIKNVAVGAFCHNPTVYRTPDGNIIIMHIGGGEYHDGIPPMVCNSHNGSTDIPAAEICKKKYTHTSGVSHQQDYFEAGSFSAGDQISPPNIAYSKSPLGPFKQLGTGPEGWGANNPAAHINDDGSIVLVTKFSCNSTINPDNRFCRQFGLFTAPAWNANYTFVKMLEVFGEDPYVWRSEQGGLHMVADLSQYTPALPPFAKGTFNPRHAYSNNDGLDWVLNVNSSGVPTKGSIPLENGTSLDLTRRERPQFLFSARIFGQIASPAKPLALFSAGALGNTHEQGGDQTLTLVQPFRR